MTPPDYESTQLTYIEAAALECLDFVGNLSVGEFFNDRKTQAAVVWQLCVIGEAANRLHADTRRQALEIDWRGIIGIRNILIHEFQDIDYTIVWRVAHEELHPLIASARRVINSLNDNSR